jgi:hypothetical protein
MKTPGGAMRHNGSPAFMGAISIYSTIALLVKALCIFPASFRFNDILPECFNIDVHLGGVSKLGRVVKG